MERRSTSDANKKVDCTRVAAERAGESVQHSNWFNSPKNKHNFNNAVYNFEQAVFQHEELKKVERLDLTEYLISNSNEIHIISSIRGEDSSGRKIKIDRWESYAYQNKEIRSDSQKKKEQNKLEHADNAKIRAIVDGNKLPREKANALYWSLIGSLKQRNRAEKKDYVEDKDIPGNLTAKDLFNLFLNFSRVTAKQKPRRYTPKGEGEGVVFSPLMYFPKRAEALIFTARGGIVPVLIEGHNVTHQEKNPMISVLNIDKRKVESYGGGTTACEASYINNFPRLKEKLIFSSSDRSQSKRNLNILKKFVTPEFQRKVGEFIKNQGINMELTTWIIDADVNKGKVVEMLVRGTSFFGLDVEEIYRIESDPSISKKYPSLFFVEKGSSPSKIDKLTLVTLVKPDNSALDVAKKIIKSAYGREITSFSDKDT